MHESDVLFIENFIGISFLKQITTYMNNYDQLKPITEAKIIVNEKWFTVGYIWVGCGFQPFYYAKA